MTDPRQSDGERAKDHDGNREPEADAVVIQDLDALDDLGDVLGGCCHTLLNGCMVSAGN